MLQEKIYEIAGVKCRINFDQTLREVKEIDEMIARSSGFDLTIADTERLLSIILKADAPVDILELKESLLSEILAEYFSKKKIWMLNLVESLLSSVLEENGLNLNLPDTEKAENAT